jgi:hypothetical protein
MDTLDIKTFPSTWSNLIWTHSLNGCKWFLWWSVASLCFRWIFRYLIRHSNILLHQSNMDGNQL